MSDFVHLHNHSHYSLQDGAATVDALIQAAKENEMNSIALTDHGVMYGAYEFYRKAKKENIKPIIGIEAYVVSEGSRFDKGKSHESGNDGDINKKRVKHYNHLVLLAKNKIGYKNLIKLCTVGHKEGFYYRPRVDLETIRKYSEGLVCLSACAAGVVSANLINNDYKKARDSAITYKEIFGDDYYLELQDHSTEIDKPVLEGMPKLSKELGIKLVATNDIHYINKDHATAHNILLLFGDKSGNSDYLNLRYGTDEIYFKSAEEMKKLFRKFNGAIENTLEIDSKIDLNLDFEGHHFPVFPIPSDSKAKNLDDYFELLAAEGLHKKFKSLNREIEDRFKFEVETIKTMGYSGYFLIVQDFVNAAKQMRIPVGPGRGSAAGSLVAFVLGITNVNPLDYNLLFERFLNPSRKSMPDIDIDFADNQRGEVIDYVRHKYGENSVSQIITFNTLSSKQVLRDVARVLKIPIPTVNNVTKHIPSVFGKVFSIEQALKEVPELKWVRDSNDQQIKDWIKYSKILEGMNRNASKHAAGVVIAPGDVSDYVPLAAPGAENEFVTQYNMKELENAGLLKMDFLGLRTLTIIKDTLELVKKNRNIDIDLENIPLDDQLTYDLFAKGQTTAVFQFDSPPMREYLRKLKPTSINDLAAMNALYRPGPMKYIDSFIDTKHGKKQASYLHPILEEILKETYGIIVYQEQVIQIANKVGGMSLAEADILRRAMGKKDVKAMEQQKEFFINGAVKNNIPQKIASQIFDAIFEFANYGFNKSHAVAYSILAYQTAFLKAHYLHEFLAANLSNEYGNSDKVTVLLEDCRKLKVTVSPPDVNHPSVYFNVVNDKIIFGMVAIKNVGMNAVEEIRSSRKKLDRDFRSIYDFCANVDTRIVNKRTLEGLVLAGALDSVKGFRSQNFEAVEQALNYGNKISNLKNSDMDSLFGSVEETIADHEPELPGTQAWEPEIRLAKEREVLGFYLTDHPLSKYKIEFRSFATVQLGVVESFGKNSEMVKAVGVITDVKTKIDKSNKTMSFFRLDDFTGSCECYAFSSIYEKFGKNIREEATVYVTAKAENSGDSYKLKIEEVYDLNFTQQNFTSALYIIIREEENNIEQIRKLQSVLSAHSGKTAVYINYLNSKNESRKFILEGFSVKISSQLLNELVEIIGDESILLLNKQ